MGDSEYWKRRYKDVWPAGCEREKKFLELFESWGFEPIPYGFEALSTEYNPESPEERGKPDFYIEFNHNLIYFEVTGTNVRTITPNHELWLRPDKVGYVQRHNLRAYACHILDNSYNLTRFIDMNSITERNIVHPIIRGTRETYIAIDPNNTISISEMKRILRIN